MEITTGKRIEILVLSLIAIIIALLFYIRLSRHDTVQLPPIQITKYLKDSTHYLESTIAMEESTKKIKELQDALQQSMTKGSDITPSTIIKYKELLAYTPVSAYYLDSVDKMLVTMIEQQRHLDSLRFSGNPPAIDYSNLIRVPKKFKFKEQWVDGVGTIYNDKVILDTINIISEPTIVFGERHGVVKALVGNKNPFATQSELSSYTYKPKQKIFSMVVGPSYIFDGKSLKLGVGVSLGIKIF